MIQHIRTSLFALLSLLCLPLSAQDFAVGADISWSTEQESRGELYKNWNGEPREAFALMKEIPTALGENNIGGPSSPVAISK
jgi:arabinogalactan endo-1,4-beta-galactosidase